LEPNAIGDLIAIQAIVDLVLGVAVIWLLYRDWGG